MYKEKIPLLIVAFMISIFLALAVCKGVIALAVWFVKSGNWPFLIVVPIMAFADYYLLKKQLGIIK
jgi:hypothetical protein